ncbi:hypothetical protein [Nocardioides sp. B-3]|uniref:hypothetical protein n=1 Tax=Nocardioides sp. B-3 TaxID=2895565 RepID=UPI003FA5BBF4
MTPPPAIATLGELRASGHELKSLRVELRDNLLARLRAGVDPWPGLHGFADTVIPQLERALIAGHDLVLLGERGRGKTRLLRSLVGLLDEWSPVISGSVLGEHPYDPITITSKQSLATYGDELRISPAPPRRALFREAGHPRHERGRPDRRRRSDEGGRGAFAG